MGIGLAQLHLPLHHKSMAVFAGSVSCFMCISQQRGAHKGDEDIARPQSPQGANLHNELSSPFAEVMFGFEKICYNQMQICSFVLIAESV